MTDRIHRVGTFTSGITLILFGSLFLIHLFYDFMTYKIIFSLWPIILILLGIELLLSLIASRNYIYDKGAIFIVITMMFFSLGSLMIPI